MNLSDAMVNEMETVVGDSTTRPFQVRPSTLQAGRSVDGYDKPDQFWRELMLSESGTRRCSGYVSQFLAAVPTTASTHVSFNVLARSPAESERVWRTLTKASRWHAYVADRLAQMKGRTGETHGPSLETLNAAWNFIDRLLPPSTPTPSVLPSEEGDGVEFVWQKGGWDIQLEVASEGVPTVWMRDRGVGGDQFYGSVSDHQALLLEVLEALAVD